MKKSLFLIIAILIIVSALGIFLYISTEKETKKQEKPTTEEKRKSSPKETEPPAVQYEKINIYFSDDQAQYLVPETRQAPKTDDVTKTASFAVNELIKGPEEPDHYRTIQQGVKLIGVESKGAILYVDFSKEFSQTYPQGSAAETITIYSIVNTLTELPNVEKVKFLVEGSQPEVVGGQMDLTRPISRNKSIIKSS